MLTEDLIIPYKNEENTVNASITTIIKNKDPKIIVSVIAKSLDINFFAYLDTLFAITLPAKNIRNK